MALLKKLPEVRKCCGCITDMKTAAAIIAVLGIVTSPAVSWAVVRHSYVLRVSCFVNTNTTRPDIIDINLNHILSFGFGANAGLGPSCLMPSKKNTSKPTLRTNTEPANSGFVNIVKYLGWIVLAADVVFLICSINFLIRIFKGDLRLTMIIGNNKVNYKSPQMYPTPRVAPLNIQKKTTSTRTKPRAKGKEKKAAKVFMIAAIVSVLLSFIYGMLYISACVSVGGAFPIYELVFSFIDLIMWIYFLIVVHSYRGKSSSSSS